MNFERFDREYSNLVNLLGERGFRKKQIFVKIIDYPFEANFITSRLEEEIAESDSLIKSIFKDYKSKKEVNKTKMEKWVRTLAKVRLDIMSFYIFTRIFLDTLTKCIKLYFESIGNKKWNTMKDSVTYLLNEKKMQTYKNEIDFNFFDGLEKRVSWIHDFKNSRDGLLHKYSYLVFTKTREGELGYDIMDGVKKSWGTDTVRGILNELQRTIDNLSDLMEYLSKNLPRTS